MRPGSPSDRRALVRGGGEAPRAVVDIGSNSVRLVVWSGATRVPEVVLNEKVNASLGRSLAKDGRLPAKAMEVALRSLARFVRLVDLHGVEVIRVVATAAVRDAANGAEFLDRVRALGLDPELLSGEAEAEASAMGVLSAFPNADGVVGDLGGGSLELVEVRGGEASRAISLPWGTLRLAEMRAAGAGPFERRIRDMLDGAGWRGAAAGRGFYLVGGSWRALTQVAMHDAGFPLLDPHGYEMSPERAAALAVTLATGSPKRLQDVPRLANARIASLPDAGALLAAVTSGLKPQRLVTSAFGLREGLLFASLDAATRRLDPLIASVRDYCGFATGRSVDGALLAQWIAPLFATDDRSHTRLRVAACYLARIVQAAPNEMRAQRAIDTALHERWIGLRGGERALVAAALLSDAGERVLPAELRTLCAAGSLDQAIRWGQAMRFGRKLSGNAPEVLLRSALELGAGRLVLRLDPSIEAIYGEGAQQQHRALATQLGLEPAVETIADPAGDRRRLAEVAE